MTMIVLNNCWVVTSEGEKDEVLGYLRDLARGFVLYEDIVHEESLSDRLLAVVLMHLSGDRVGVGPVDIKLALDFDQEPTYNVDAEHIVMDVTPNRAVTCWVKNEPEVYVDFETRGFTDGDVEFLVVASSLINEVVDDEITAVTLALETMGWTKRA